MKINKTEKEFLDSLRRAFDRWTGDGDVARARLSSLIAEELDVEFEPEKPEPEVLHEWKDAATGEQLRIVDPGGVVALELEHRLGDEGRWEEMKPTSCPYMLLVELAGLAQERKGRERPTSPAELAHDALREVCGKLEDDYANAERDTAGNYGLLYEAWQALDQILSDWEEEEGDETP